MTYLSDVAVRRLRDAGRWPEFRDERYCALEEIGRGGMGTVFRATDALLGRDVAIKVSGAVAAGGDLDARLTTEAGVLARLEHPGIVPVHDAGRLADGRLFVVMKLVRGETLDRHLESVPDLAARLRIFERICEPVAFAHARGLVHRDLKPSNVMVGAFGEVLVMDWGVAMLLRSDAPADVVVGTPGYMAPEQARAGAVDARADVYALGAILGMLLAERVAGDGERAPTSPRHVPRRLRSIRAKACAESPVDRYASVEALAEDVARFRAGRPVLAHREGPIERAGRVLHTYRGAVLLVAAYLFMRVVVALVARR